MCLFQSQKETWSSKCYLQHILKLMIMQHYERVTFLNVHSFPNTAAKCACLVHDIIGYFGSE